jgi:RNA polymerase sigma-70 factor (ECF subfamily)
VADEVGELVRRSLSGDQSAMTALVGRFGGQVFGLCYRMLGCRQDAEDVVQEAFLRALRNLSRWDPQRPFEPWLLAIAGNRCRSLLARRRRLPRPSEMVEDAPARQPDLRPAQDLAEELQRALNEIRPEYREAFLLFHERQLSYIDIAASLEVPLGTVKTWVHRARRDLARRLIERGAVPENPQRDAQHALPRV